MIYTSGAILIAEWIDPVKTTIQCTVDKEISNIAEITAKQLLSAYEGVGGVSLSQRGVSISQEDVPLSDEPSVSQSATDILKSLKLPRNDILKVCYYSHYNYCIAGNLFGQNNLILLDFPMFAH